MRPGWPQRMIALAELWATYSTCKRAQVGAVIFHPVTKAVLSIGFNDTAIGDLDCGDGGCQPCIGPLETSLFILCGCIHAELNAILLAARRGSSVEGCSIAVTRSPCTSCQKAMIQAGIEQIYLSDKVYCPVASTKDEADNSC